VLLLLAEFGKRGHRAIQVIGTDPAAVAGLNKGKHVLPLALVGIQLEHGPDQQIQ